MPAGGLPRAAAAAAAQAAPDARLPPAAATAAGEPLPLHLAGLSEEQLAAATAPAAAPLRVVAGPGSGKTRVLAARAAHLIHAHGARPWQVAAITFTNKAADELRARLAGALGEAAGRELFAATRSARPRGGSSSRVPSTRSATASCGAASARAASRRRAAPKGGASSTRTRPSPPLRRSCARTTRR
jgi:hypothetical protein